MSLLKLCRRNIKWRNKHLEFLCFHQKRCLTEISEKDRSEFKENGVVCLRNIFNESWLKLCERGVQKNILSPSIHHDWLVDGDGKGLFFNDYYNCNKIFEYYEYVTKSPAAQIAKQLMDSEKISLFHEHVFYKEEGSTKETPWHHDQAYYPLNGMKNCSIWMPTKHVPKQSSLKFIQGSHQINKWFVPRHFKNNESYNTDYDDHLDNVCDIDTILENIDSYKILQWELQPGDCIVFHMRTIHGTDMSVSDKQRIVVSTRWLGDDMTYCSRPWNTSPPKELLPKYLKIGDVLVDNKGLLSADV